MSGFTFDSNILIDALGGYEAALAEIEAAVQASGIAWISRMVWIEVLSKGTPEEIQRAEAFMENLDIEDMDVEIAIRAAELRRQRVRLRSPDAIILATAQLRGHTLVTRNTRDFPPDMPGIRVPYTL